MDEERKIVFTRPMPVWKGATAKLNADGLWQNIGNPTPITPDGFRPTEITFSDGRLGCRQSDCCGSCDKAGVCGYWYDADARDMFNEPKTFDEVMTQENMEFASRIVGNLIKQMTL
ncbi:MAG: hypothetical protein LBL21_01155 [Rickettsiales bacterium]|nr:hypothetical protein [Rickettsiales bacterium]